MFERPRRSVFSALGLSSGAVNLVRSEVELQQAITAALATQQETGVTLALNPQRIIIAAPITLTKPVEITGLIFGLSIESVGRGARIDCTGTLSAFFIVKGSQVTIRDLYVQPGAGTVESFVRVDGESASAPDGLAPDLWILDCHATGAFTYFLYRPTSALSALANARVRGCGIAGNVDIDSANNCRFVDNDFNGNSIVLRAGAENTIALNTMNQGTITTDGTSGLNVVAPNTDINAGSAFAGSDSSTGVNT